MKPFAWSFSRLNSFLTCPRSFSEITVYKRVKYVQGPEAKWGERAHKHCENYVNGQPLHTDMLAYADQINTAIRSTGYRGVGPISAEYQAALNGKFLPVDWFAKDVWNRAVLDVLRIEGSEAWVIDWKMGKVKPDLKQLKLFALMVFYHFPQVTIVNTRYEWLQFGVTTREIFKREDIGMLWAVFELDLRSYVQAFREEMWQERPSGLCKRHCEITACVHNGRNS